MAMNKTFPLFEIDVNNDVNPITNPTAVEFWSTGAGAAKLKDLNSGITNNGDGTYTLDISDVPTGVYQIKVDFGTGLTEPDEFKFLRIEGYDSLSQADVDDDTLEFDGDLHVKNDGVGKAKINADVAGSGMKQNTDGSLSPDIDDTAGNGATTKLWSADKIFDELALKADQADIGDASFTKRNVVADAAAVNSNIDKLDKAIGNLDMGGDPLMKAFYTSLMLSPGYPNIASYLRCLSIQIIANLHAITKGTAIWNNRIVYSDATVAADAAGSAAPALPLSAETSASYIHKRRNSFYLNIGDKYLKVKFYYSVSASSVAKVQYDDLITQKEDQLEEGTGIRNMIIDISAYSSEKITWVLKTKVVSGGGNITISSVEISVTGA